MSEHWKEPESGKFSVAIPGRDFQTKVAELEQFVGRRLSTYSHCLSFKNQSDVVVFVQDETDAKLAIGAVPNGCFCSRVGARGRIAGAILTGGELLSFHCIRMQMLHSSTSGPAARCEKCLAPVTQPTTTTVEAIIVNAMGSPRKIAARTKPKNGWRSWS